MRLVLVSGDWVRPELARAAVRACPSARFVALGGATEASIWSNFFEVSGEPPAGWPSVPYGRPLRNQVFRVVDERGEDRPDWVAGELWIGGLGVAQGYAGDPGRSAEKFVTWSGRRWYRTGDLGRWRPGGWLEILGRRDNQVKVHGHRIELGEIEAALLGCPGVTGAVAVVASDPTPHIHAFVTTDDAEPAGQEGAWRSRLADQLPAHMIPRHLSIIDEIPLTTNGKTDRAALTRRTGASTDTTIAAPPQNPIEELIATTWATTLNLTTIDRHHNFFTLGGDSITATSTVAVIQRETGVALTLRQVYENPTAAGIAALVHQRLPDRAAMPMEEGVV